MRHSSHIERNARVGQTSQQLAERNALRRIVLYGVLGGIAGGIGTSFLITSWVTLGAFLGVLAAVSLAIAIEQKLRRDDQNAHTARSAQMAREREENLESLIQEAKAKGEFDRWNNNT